MATSPHHEAFQRGLRAMRDGDFATAMKEWGPLAEQGDAAAQYNLGQLYRTGSGVRRNFPTATMWYKLAAEQGHAGAQSNLGAIYAEGLGTVKVLSLAHMWWSLAAEQGHDAAKRNLAILEPMMSPSQIDTARRYAADWRKRHAAAAPSAA